MKTINGVTFDEKALENSLNEFLQTYGREVDEFFTNEKIVDALDNNHFDAVFSKWIENMRGKLGPYALSAILISSDVDFLYGISKIVLDMFRGSDYLLSLTLPANITTIEERAFYECQSLKSIAIPNTVISISRDAFAICTSLTSVTIPYSVISIRDYAFQGCQSLTSIKIPNSVISIGRDAFYDCISLNSIIIPNSVRSIGDYAFANCYSLKSATISDSVTSISPHTF